MTTIVKGFGNDLVDEREWSIIHLLGHQGRSAMVTVAAGGDRTVTVPVGILVICGLFFEVTVAESLQAAANSSGSTRFDVVVARFTWSTNTAVLAIKQGTPGGGQPTMQQDVAAVWEEPLALLQVANGQGTFTSGDVSVMPSSRYPQETIDGTNQTGINQTSPTNGSPVCGVTFTAPPRQAVLLQISGDLHRPSGNNQAIVIVGRIRLGRTIGSGTLIYEGDGDSGPQIILDDPTTNPTRIKAGSNIKRVSGLTPGTLYNAHTAHYVQPGQTNGEILSRTITVIPER